MATYQLHVQNESNQSHSFVIFQKPPIYTPELTSLAWRTVSLPPNGRGNLQWETDFEYHLGGPGALSPGVHFKPMMMTPSLNEPILVSEYAGQIQFQRAAKKSHSDSLVIYQAPNVPAGHHAVGMGMNRTASLMAPCQPDRSLHFETEVKYFIGVGNYQQGEVLPDTIPTSSLLLFQDGVKELHVSLNNDMTWTIGK